MKLILSALLVIISAVVSGCDGSSTPATTATGRFIDGPVAGLTYVSGSHSGTTAADGSFIYEIGKAVKFSINGVIIGEAPAEAVMTPIQLALVSNPNANASSTEVVNIVRFLMSASTIDAAGNMTIDPTKVMTTASPQAIAFSNSTSVFRGAMNTIAPAISSISTSQVVSHLTTSIYNQCAGTYSGTYTGIQATFVPMTSATSVPSSRNTGGEITNDSTTVLGSWTATIRHDGTVTGSTSQGDVISGTLKDGTVFNGVVGASMRWTGNLNLSKKMLSGTISSIGRNQGSGVLYTFTGSM